MSPEGSVSLLVVIPQTNFMIYLLSNHRHYGGVANFIRLDFILLVGIALAVDIVEQMFRQIGYNLNPYYP